jgi:Ca2+-binding RTX toxin-like protein
LSISPKSTPDGITQHHTQHLVEGTAAGISLTAPPLPADIEATLGTVTAEATLRIGHAFINDMAATAAPFDAFGTALVADSDSALGLSDTGNFYDNELLDQHFVAGDGRVNENIGLTTVHQIFENEHNRLVQVVRDQVQTALDAGDTSFALGWVKSAANLALTADDLAAGRTVHLLTDADFNGERLFQAAKYGTETQYQHLVFEEFARKVVPTIHVAGETNIHLDPAITSEFANAVYRFGHSMLDESIQVQNVNPDGSPMVDALGNPVFTQEGLIQAFTNPLDFLKYGAAGIAQGATNQVGNEIDEFVTGALRNNLLGLPLDLAAINIARGRDTGIPTLNAFRNEIYQQTHDANLRPYMSWDDFRLYLKHDASIVNFVAAYGNYDDILNATTDAAKRQVALELVTGTHINSVSGVNDSFDFMHSTGIYANVANPTAAINQTDPRLLHEVELDPVTHQPVLDASGQPVMEVAPWSTGSVTGLDNVDMWIGGLAEKQSLNGSLLGTTFELIFRVQLENLQDADRLYYLPRVEGLHYSDQIENNTFADMIQTDLPGTHHLPAAIFMTMEYNIEAKDFYQTNADGTFALDAHGNPQYDLGKIDAWNLAHPAAPGAAALLEVTAKGELHFNGEDYFFGNTMVLGGTDANDKLLAGNADDDTVWGDGGNDSIDGGGGNDNLFGGAGDDIISDQAGANVAHGDAGNDTILMGKGADVVFGGDGNDLIVAGGGDDEVLGGTGNDIIFGGEGADEMEGDQGDDWIDGRGMNVDPKFGGQEGGDNIFGDVGAPTGQLPLYDGNDVLLGGVGTKMKGFGGDDIMLGVGGFTKFYGGTGFDWASFEQETQGISADMQRREFVSPLNPLDGDGFRTVFTHVEGISGSQFGDDLIGENSDKVARLLAKDELYNFNLVHGLVDLNFGTPALRSSREPSTARSKATSSRKARKPSPAATSCSAAVAATGSRAPVAPTSSMVMPFCTST